MTTNSHNPRSSSRIDELTLQKSKPNRTRRSSFRSAYDDEADEAFQTALATEEIGIATLVKLKEQTGYVTRYIAPFSA
jgi:hypothetical protein